MRLFYHPQEVSAMELKETLVYYRKRQGLSQIELAEELSVSRQTVSKWETGSALPSAENLLALSKLYGVSADALLNAERTEDVPEPVLLPAPPSPPKEKRTLNPRRLIVWMLAAVLVCDLIAFFMDASVYADVSAPGFLHFTQIFRILSCCAIGLCFAWLDRAWPARKRTSLLIAAAALVLAVYPIMFPTPLLWKLYDWIAWSGLHTFEAAFPPNPVRTCVAWTLCDEIAILSHGCLVICFQLGRLRFSGRLSRVRRQEIAPQT